MTVPASPRRRGLPVKDVQALRADGLDEPVSSDHAALLPHDADRLRQQPAAPRPAYEKIAADVDRALQAADGFDDALRHGQRRALAERLQAARARRRGSARRTATGWSGEFRDVWALLEHLVRRLHPDDRAAPQCGVQEICAPGHATAATSTRATTRAGTASLRGLPAGEGSGRRHVPAPRTQPSSWLRSRTISSGSRSSSSRCSTIRPTPSSSRRRSAATRCCGCSKRASRTSRSAAPARLGHSGAGRSVERRLRLVRRADQLHHGGRLRHRRGAVRRRGGRPTCT